MFYFAFWRRVSRDSLHFLILRFCAHLIFANFMTYAIWQSYILILVGYVDEHFQHLLQNIIKQLCEGCYIIIHGYFEFSSLINNTG